MAGTKLTIGQAIDALIEVLEPLDEKARDTVLAAVSSHLTISNVRPPPVTHERSLDLRQDSASEVPAFPFVDIRSFKAQKQPKSAQQMACLVAFYLQEIAPAVDRKSTVTTVDLEKYFKQANFKLPGKIRQILPDGKIAGYFDSAGRGEYKLNAVGYNLVAHGMSAKAE